MDRSLPLVTAPTAAPVRRDAARNREALLAAANALIAEGGVAALTMDAVACRAGVGKGTLFRRFGTREGLMATLLDESERRWQEAAMSGPPPLGPGAPARDRLLAFAGSRLEEHVRQDALIRAAGTTWGDNQSVIGFHVLHVRHLLLEAGITGDATYPATVLVTMVSPPVLRQQLDAARLTPSRVLTGWTDLLDRLLPAD
ncbi:TetR/AcrR family transcriptional regulator [Nocardioides sp.]|uniref:TetR/AcrR family transcriptional regulator n=1 Tax=Nocardioides sp. TaxID=35761 RepID=UPI003513A5A8